MAKNYMAYRTPLISAPQLNPWNYKPQNVTYTNNLYYSMHADVFLIDLFIPL